MILFKNLTMMPSTVKGWQIFLDGNVAYVGGIS